MGPCRLLSPLTPTALLREPKLPVVIKLQCKGLRLWAHLPYLGEGVRVDHRVDEPVRVEVVRPVVRVKRLPRFLGRSHDMVVVRWVVEENVSINGACEARGAGRVGEGLAGRDERLLVNMVPEDPGGGDLASHSFVDFRDPLLQVRLLGREVGGPRGVLDGREDAKHAGGGPALAGGPVAGVDDTFVVGSVGGDDVMPETEAGVVHDGVILVALVVRFRE